MPIETIPVVLRLLTPERDGNWLTNGEVYSQEIYLGKDTDPKDWWEITAEEYEEIISQTVDGL